MEKSFVLERLGHTDDGTHRVSTGIVAGITCSGDEYDGNALQSRSCFDVSAKVKARETIAFNFSNDERGSEELEHLVAVASVVDGDYFVPSAAEDNAGSIKKGWFGIKNQNERFGVARFDSTVR